jgi:hypothetical protein
MIPFIFWFRYKAFVKLFRTAKLEATVDQGLYSAGFGRFGLEIGISMT